MSADIICLSSDDEEDQPKKKRVKLTRVSSNNCSKLNESIILSDDDDDENRDCEEEKASSESTIDLKMPEENDTEANVIEDPLDIEDSEKVNEEENNEEVNEVEKNVEDSEEDKENNGIEKPIENETDVSFRDFCAKCREYIEKLDETEMLNARLNSLVKMYAKLKKYDELDDFVTFFEAQMKQMDCAPTPMIAFHSVFKWALDRYGNVKKKREKQDKLLKTLNKTLMQLERKIEKLKNAEVDLDDEEGSSYLKCEAFERRYVQVYMKLCKLQGTDPNEGRITYLPLRFQHSTNSLINKAINHKYKDSNLLPDFYEFNKFLRKFVERGGIKMTEEKLKVEIRSCFEHLTNLVKKNRQRELYEVQKHFIGSEPDETLKDSNFNAKIKEGRQKGIVKMNEVINKYVELQEAGAEPSLSSDSDNSNYEEESL